MNLAAQRQVVAELYRLEAGLLATGIDSVQGGLLPLVEQSEILSRDGRVLPGVRAGPPRARKVTVWPRRQIPLNARLEVGLLSTGRASRNQAARDGIGSTAVGSIRLTAGRARCHWNIAGRSRRPSRSRWARGPRSPSFVGIRIVFLSSHACIS